MTNATQGQYPRNLTVCVISTSLTNAYEEALANVSSVGATAGYSGISGANLAASLQRQVGRRGTLEVYASPGLAVTRIIGPVTDIPAGWTRNGDAQPCAAAKRAKRGGGCAAVALRAVERGTAVSFHLDIVKPLEAKAYVQVGAPLFQSSYARSVQRDIGKTTTSLRPLQNQSLGEILDSAPIAHGCLVHASSLVKRQQRPADML